MSALQRWEVVHTFLHVSGVVSDSGNDLDAAFLHSHRGVLEVGCQELCRLAAFSSAQVPDETG